MNKTQLVEKLTTTMKLRHSRAVSKTDVNAFLDSLAYEVHEALATDDEVTLPSLGKLSVSERKERQGRNPQTGKAITIPAAKVPKFTATKALKDALNR